MRDIYSSRSTPLTVLHAVVYLGSITTRDFINEPSGFWLGGVNGRYLEETGGQEESEVDMVISLLPPYQALIDSSYSLLPEAMAPIGQYFSFGSGLFRLH